MTAPVRSLRETLAAKTGEDLAPVVDEAIPSEIQPLVDAVNGLLSRVGELREREARFVADAAHELRSPLAALSLQAERLSKEQLSPAARERVDNLRRVIDRAVRQVNQLLVLKRAQASATGAASAASGAASADAAAAPAADIAAAIGRAVEDVWPDIERKRLEFEVEGLDDDASDDDRLLPISEDDLFTILRNLLENAARYTPEGGAIRLRCELGRKRITVRDTGPGIASEERGRVFDPFYRVLGTGVTGTGLGLAIVKTLAEKYGWRVTLADAAPTAAPGAKGLAVTIEPCED
nr:ATP-binding protein [Sutterella massiliensis]